MKRKLVKYFIIVSDWDRIITMWSSLEEEEYLSQLNTYKQLYPNFKITTHTELV